jgi:hypothetical protein
MGFETTTPMSAWAKTVHALDGTWRIKTTEELDNLLEHKNIIHFKIEMCHVERMTEERDVKKTYKWKLIASRPVGRTKIRWMHNVMKGIQAMEIVNWKR